MVWVRFAQSSGYPIYDEHFMHLSRTRRSARGWRFCAAKYYPFILDNRRYNTLDLQVQGFNIPAPLPSGERQKFRVKPLAAATFSKGALSEWGSCRLPSWTAPIGGGKASMSVGRCRHVSPQGAANGSRALPLQVPKM